MKRIVCALLSALLILACCCGVAEETPALQFIPGEELVVFEQDGVKLTLTGGVEDEGYAVLQLNAVVENQTDKSISIVYGGAVNGWSINNLGLGGAVNAGTKAKTKLWMTYEDVDIKSFNDLEEMQLTFTVRDGDTGSELFSVGPLGFTFGTLEKEVTYFEECPILPNPESIVDARTAGSNRSSVDGVLRKATYRFTAKFEEDGIEAVCAAYVEALRGDNFSVEESGDGYAVSDGDVKLADITIDGDQMIVDIVPGNEKRTERAGASEGAAEEPKGNTIALGQTIVTNEYEFTLDNVELTYEVLPESTRGVYTSYPAEKGKVYLHVDGHLKNLMKRDIRIEELFSLIGVYSEDYVYAGFVIVNDGENHFRYAGSYSAATPLETCHVHGLIEMPEEVDGSDETLLTVLKLSDGKDYTYIYRVKGQAPAKEYTDKATLKAVQEALNSKGYDCGTPDGVIGKKSQSAICAYQTDNGLSVTGKVTDELLNSLGISAK